MKYEDITVKLEEVTEIEKTIAGTLDRARAELSEAAAESKATRHLSEIDTFLSGLLQGLEGSQSAEEMAKSLVSGISKLQAYVKGESQRIKDRLPAAKERIAVLESVNNFLNERKVAHTSRLAAIERVADGDTDPRHPEKIAVTREAERLKKNRKQVDS
jgi:rubrerythrin